MAFGIVSFLIYRFLQVDYIISLLKILIKTNEEGMNHVWTIYFDT